MKTIKEDYCSREIYKILIEKGFDGEVHTTFDEEGYIQPSITHQMAMKWLREVHHYYIQVMLDGWALGEHSGYYVIIQKTDSDFEMMVSDALDEVFYKTPEVAVEAAINYCLKNLI